MQRLHSSSSNRHASTWLHSLLSWRLGQGLRPPAPGNLMPAALVLEMPDIAQRHGWLRLHTLLLLSAASCMMQHTRASWLHLGDSMPASALV